MGGFTIMAVFGVWWGGIVSKFIDGRGLGLGMDIVLDRWFSCRWWVFQAAGISIGGGIIRALLAAVIGAVIVLLIVKAIKKA